ncbi:MAG TPA: response regulator transcription factor [Phycicoccus elongatus]|uniref:Transcriptional regulatory protein degU n=1 Tax=Phycicoccus elongatus Lp2 TaxID=1193181 RepID=N0DYC6_9MICO|nr:MULTISPECIES: response regulator transcription factor [Phycicoccus]MBK8729722.1 response regulator transcription factor [Tetrasphaera sp.]MCB1241060.1 response regulator transcription factor [Tetrasphaera sp.]MCB9407575.1 response regulator transcription factor [Tetrasphaera sp.]MCO5303909.1 response regulator transcription factor [Phycicoccus sp.]CCH69247.1 Transcriptional regulatory protein degU [Phycicoccus elongatus Lp2]
MIRVVIADDQALVRDGFSLILNLEEDIDVVAVAGDGRQCLREVARTRPDVVLMDIRMPVLDGIAATEEIMRSGASARVLILTTFDLDVYVYRALRAGASGFLLKDVPRQQLAAAVRIVADGGSVVGPAITQRLIEHFVGRPPVGNPLPPTLRRLTVRESEILRALAQGRSNRELARALALSDATVKTHVATILAKLGVRDRLQAVVLAYESGFVQPGRVDDANSPGGPDAR